MDDGLVLTNARAYDYCKAVLILVVVGDGLVLAVYDSIHVSSFSLNPCCSGRWSRTEGVTYHTRATKISLNPCCSGRWSRTAIIKALRELNFVLILVVVDNGIVLTF